MSATTATEAAPPSERIITDWRRFSIPQEVNLLDYAGYQLQVSAAADKPDWQAMSRAAADAVRLWNAMAKSKVSNRPLREVMTSSTQPRSVSDLKTRLTPTSDAAAGNRAANSRTRAEKRR